MQGTFTLMVHCDKDGNPVDWSQRVGAILRVITDEVFDALVGTPCCKGVEVTVDDSDEEEE